MSTGPRIAPGVETYISRVQPKHRDLFDRLHRLVLETLPEAEVVLSYNMPAYVVPGGRVSLSDGKAGVSVATTVAEPVAAFHDRHPRFKAGKVTVLFPPDAELPLDDLRALVRAATSGR